jgi:hypothetical protein
VTEYYGVSAPLGSGKTTAAIEFAGRLAQTGVKYVIAQPSINLINQSIGQFSERWSNVAGRAIHSETTDNVAREIANHTRAISSGEALFVTHAALMQSVYWDRRSEWHLIVDEAPQVFYHMEFTLPHHYDDLLPALDVIPYNVRYSRLRPCDVALLNEIAENSGGDQVCGLFQQFAAKLASRKWDMFVLNEQWERFQSGKVSDGKLLVFGLIDPFVFDDFATTTIMSANLERTVAYQHMVQHGHTFKPHKAIIGKLRYTEHTNGHLLTVHYAVEDGIWSKRRRNKPVQVGDETYSVNDLIVGGALDLFGDDQFAWLANKDIEDKDPFGGLGIKLPHTPHGLNCFQHIHNAAVIAALHPSPALYAFLDEVAHLDSNEIRRAVYHEAAYQAAGRISTRNPADHTPKHVVVADRAAAESLAELYPGAHLMPLPFSDLIPKSAKRGPKRIHATSADRKAAYRERWKSDLLAQLDAVNDRSSETHLPYSIKVNSSLTNATFGGSMIRDIYQKHPTGHAGAFAASDFIEWLRDLHSREVGKENAWLWSPAEFEEKTGINTGRGLANITAIWGVWLDNDGGELAFDEFAVMFPHLMMVIHNSSSSAPDAPRWRAIIPTTCAMTIDVHREIMSQIRQALNRRGYYDKNQLRKRVEKGLAGKDHGFDPSKYTAASMFYLPAQAALGAHASFFLVFDGGRRQPIDPYLWIDKSIINHRPEPDSEPVPASTAPICLTRKDPKLTRFLQEMEAERQERWGEAYQCRVSAALDRWRHHAKGSGNDEFFQLAASLSAAGMPPVEVERTLYAELPFAHGPESQRDRKADVPRIMRWLRCAA